MHQRLEEQLRQAIADPKTQSVDLPKLLALIDQYYERLDADQAESRGAPSALRAAFDNVADAVITLDQTARITFANRTAGFLFGCDASELAGLPLSRLLPVTTGLDIEKALESCLTRLDDTQFEIQRAEFDAQRLDGKAFVAEVNASPLAGDPRNDFVVCIRDITERREARRTLRENEERYRALVENAPEAILVFDVDQNQFVDVNEHATRLFNMSRKRLMKIGPSGISPEYQMDGSSSFGQERGHVRRALDGEQPVFEWLHLDADGNEIPCEVRFSRLPSSGRQLIRASITSIAARKRRELLTYGENRILELIASGAEVGSTLKAICRTLEQAIPGARGVVMLRSRSGIRLASAPSAPTELRTLLAALSIERSDVPSVTASVSGRQSIHDFAHDEPAEGSFAAALVGLGIKAAWSFPIVSADDQVYGTLDVYLEHPESPGTHDLDAIANLVRLAGIAVKRDLDEQALRDSEQRFRGLFENVVDGVYISNPAGRITAANPALVTMLGFESVDELMAQGVTDALYVNGEDRRRFVEVLHREMVVKNFEVRLRRKDGSQIVVLENARAVRDRAGVIVAHEGTITDITDRKLAETRVFEEKERAQVTLNSIGDGVITTDANGCVDYLNPVAADLIGWEPRAARGRTVDQVLTAVAANTRELLDNPVLRCLREGRVITLPEGSALVDHGGKAIEIQDSTAPIRDRIGNVIGAVMVFHELNKASRLSRQLSYQAAHDPLTGLINRREFENRLAAHLAESVRDSRVSHALLLIDIDQFKVINDTLGHKAGDEYLRQLSDVVQGEIRISDVLGRLGGDQFGVLLQNCELDRANQVGESIRRAIEQFVFNWQDRCHSARASIGIVVIDNEIKDTSAALSAADIACHAAKEEGCNRVHVFESGDTSAIRREMQWADRLTSAVEQNRLELYFQPIVAIGPLAGREPREHYELLLRLRDEVGDLIAPGQFIPAAERFNLMPMLDRWVFDKAVDDVADQVGKDGVSLYTVAINLSGNSLSDAAFLDYVAGRMAELELPEQALCFDVTETAAISNVQQVAEFMQRMRELGCIFALDDFGSGLSSFAYLKTLPINFIKIDGEFIANVSHDLMDQSLVSAISQVGRSLGVYIVAERVESPDVLETLESIGVEYAQGFLINEPQPLSEFPNAVQHQQQQSA
ncbi:MAG: EAL domain-containing protein [Pseudomonadota bacterium]